MDLAVEVAGSPDFTATLKTIPWNRAELSDFATSSTDLTFGLLDHIAEQLPGVMFTGFGLEEHGYVVDQISGITGAMARKVYQNYGRSNPPLEFVKANGRWHYRMDTSVASICKGSGVCLTRSTARVTSDNPPPRIRVSTSRHGYGFVVRSGLRPD